MARPNILVTIPRGEVFDTFFDPPLIHQLESVGQVEWNDTGRQWENGELRERLAGKEICITGWGSPILDEDTLALAHNLRLVAHNAGSVRPYVTDAVYAKGIRVCSGNRVFAESVAEGVVAYALAALRRIPQYSQELRGGGWADRFVNRGLLEQSVGIVGFGMIAEYLVALLKPFRCTVKVFSRHMDPEKLGELGASPAGLEEIFSTCGVVSLHCGMTRENYHLVTEELLEKMPEGALLINTARGAIVDEAALFRVLARRPIFAALDVFETEPLPASSPLLQCENALLMPHMGGPTIDRRRAVTVAVIGDIQRYLEGKPLECEIGCSRASAMSSY